MAQDENKTGRRALRETSLRSLNELAEKLELTTVPVRASPPLIQNLFKQVCAKVGPEDLQRLREFRDVWLENGGADLPEALLTAAERRVGNEQGKWADKADAGAVPGHNVLAQSFYTASKNTFRLTARAFMPIYNSANSFKDRRDVSRRVLRPVLFSSWAMLPEI